MHPPYRRSRPSTTRRDDSPTRYGITGYMRHTRPGTTVRCNAALSAPRRARRWRCSTYSTVRSSYYITLGARRSCVRSTFELRRAYHSCVLAATSVCCRQRTKKSRRVRRQRAPVTFSRLAKMNPSDIDNLPKAEREELLAIIETMQTRDRCGRVCNRACASTVLTRMRATACACIIAWWSAASPAALTASGGRHWKRTRKWCAAGGGGRCSAVALTPSRSA